MKNILYLVGLWAGLLGLPFLSQASADTFGSGANQFTIDFVPIGSPGNSPDDPPNPAGAVPYEYRIGKYEVSEQMIHKANALGGLGFPLLGRGLDKPATATWFDAAQFVNWLNTSANSPPAYKFDDLGIFQPWNSQDSGYNPANPFRNADARYFIPSVDEWYKAAYFDPVTNVYYDYPTGSDSQPLAVASGTLAGTAIYNQDAAAGPADIDQAGGLSPFGTMAQGGNEDEWLESTPEFAIDLRPFRGGSWRNSGQGLLSSNSRNSQPDASQFTFRVSSVVPEPNSAILFLAALIISIRHARPCKTYRE